MALPPRAEFRAAISYAHGPYDGSVRQLADRLNREGVDCELDVYDESPAQGWPQWMVDTMTDRVILAVCTEEYVTRMSLRAVPGVGKGVAWEGRLLKQRVYDDQGRNEGIVPVIFRSSDKAYIPEFLADVTHYDLSTSQGYELLYRRLTRQPRYVKPPLGPVRPMPPIDGVEPMPNMDTVAPTMQTGTAVLIDAPGLGTFVVRAAQIDRDSPNLKIVAVPDDPQASARLSALNGVLKQVDIAYKLVAVRARVRSVREVDDIGGERVELVLEEEDLRMGFGSEIGYNGKSADDIALMRARRILLDEKISQSSAGFYTGSELMEFAVSGRASTSRLRVVERSPFPVLAKNGVENKNEFLVCARLAAVLLLRLSGTVSQIFKLDLSFDSNDALQVNFVGERKPVHGSAKRIEVEGTCRLMV